MRPSRARPRLIEHGRRAGGAPRSSSDRRFQQLEIGGPRGTRTHNQRIKRIPVPGDHSLYQQLRPHRPALRPHHRSRLDTVSHHDPHHGLTRNRSFFVQTLRARRGPAASKLARSVLSGVMVWGCAAAPSAASVRDLSPVHAGRRKPTRPLRRGPRPARLTSSRTTRGPGTRIFRTYADSCSPPVSVSERPCLLPPVRRRRLSTPDCRLTPKSALPPLITDFTFLARDRPRRGAVGRSTPGR